MVPRSSMVKKNAWIRFYQRTSLCIYFVCTWYACIWYTKPVWTRTPKMQWEIEQGSLATYACVTPTLYPSLKSVYYFVGQGTWSFIYTNISKIKKKQLAVRSRVWSKWSKPMLSSCVWCDDTSIAHTTSFIHIYLVHEVALLFRDKHM